MRTLKLILLAVLVGSCNEGGFAVGAGGTFVVAVGTEQFRVRIDNTFLATQARRMMNGQTDRKIINGALARGDGGFNTGYGWHMKPDDIEFADVTIEVCDGRPSDVQGDIDHWVDVVKRYCPWGGRFVSEVGR